MYPIRFILFFFFVFITIAAQAQDRTCYDRLRQLGINDYNAGKYEAAIKKWEAAKECSFVPRNNDLSTQINKAKEKLRSYSILQNKSFEPEMVFVEGSYFIMGDNNGTIDKKPAHNVQIKDFYIGKFEVTNEEFCFFLNERKQSKEINSYWIIKDESTIIETASGVFKPKTNYENHPVIEVSWLGATAYCKWLSEKTNKKYRLLSEAEWEYAAYGGRKTYYYKYAGSNNVNEVAWYRSNAMGKTHPVGGKKANELNIHDMSGNVWEWVQDCWNPNYNNAPEDGTPNMKGDCDHHVLRGGSWKYFDNFCLVTNRTWDDPNYRLLNIGFRVAQEKD